MSEPKRKLGSTHAMGMFRKGLSELAQYLPAFNNAGTQVIEDIAIWPNQTQGEIAQARGGPGAGPNQESSNGKLTLDELRGYAKDRAQKAEHAMEHGKAREHGGLEM
jgi:hypothetical protein